MSDDDIIDAEWEEVPDNNASRAPVRSSRRLTAHAVKPPPSRADDGASPWRSKEFWHETAAPILVGAGQIAFIVLGGTFLVFLALAWSAHSSPPASEPVSNKMPDQRGAQKDAEQMLRSWTKRVTGQADASGFAMINGSGKPGDFCNNSDGGKMLKFGGETTGHDTAITIFDFFAEFHGETDSGVIGAFWYDPSDRSLLTRNQAAVSSDGEKGESLPAIVHAFDTDGEGRATIDGTTYHVCII